jgi:hypothetical protein
MDAMTTQITPSEIRHLAQKLNVQSAQVIVIGCSAFRACGPGFITDLEHRLNKPVVTSTQAYLWWMLRVAGINDRILGYGRLFSHCWGHPWCRTTVLTSMQSHTPNLDRFDPSRNMMVWRLSVFTFVGISLDTWSEMMPICTYSSSVSKVPPI